MSARRQLTPQSGALVVPERKIPNQVKQYVKSQLEANTELRSSDVAGSFTVSPTTAPSAMNNIAAANRDGEVVHFQHVRVSWTLTAPNAHALVNVALVRFLVFEWKPISIPTSADILESATPSSSIINSPHRFTNRQFYKVLIDEILPVGDYDQSGHKLVRNLKWNRKTRFNDGTAPASTMGLLYYLILSDQTVAAQQPLFHYAWRTTYTDA